MRSVALRADHSLWSGYRGSVFANAVRVGCSGWMYDSWRGDLYPEGLAKRRWLERYAERYDTVEVNSTFYRLASRDAVARWVEQTPESFVFAAKASRYLTHMKKLRDLGQGIARYYERIEPLVGRERAVALVIGDHPQRPFQTQELTAAWTFVRFHWGVRGRRGNYSEAELDAWAQKLALAPGRRGLRLLQQ